MIDIPAEWAKLSNEAKAVSSGLALFIFLTLMAFLPKLLVLVGVISCGFSGLNHIYECTSTDGAWLQPSTNTALAGLSGLFIMLCGAVLGFLF